MGGRSWMLGSAAAVVWCVVSAVLLVAYGSTADLYWQSAGMTESNMVASHIMAGAAFGGLGIVFATIGSRFLRMKWSLSKASASAVMAAPACLAILVLVYVGAVGIQGAPGLTSSYSLWSAFAWSLVVVAPSVVGVVRVHSDAASSRTSASSGWRTV